MKITFLLTLFSFFLSNLTFSQEIVVLWDSIYERSSSEILRELILLDDGNLAGVGEVRSKKNKKDALFFFIDMKKGEMVRHPFPGLRNQVFKDVVEADFGGYYLVGYKNVDGSEDQQGWLMRLDEKGKVLLNKTYGGIGGDQFEEIVWLNRGPGIIAGYNAKNAEGYLWIKTVNGNTVKEKPPIGNGFIKDLVGMEKDGNNQIWLCGNTLEEDDIWVMQSQSDFLNQKTVLVGQKNDDLVHATWVTEDGEVLIAGRTWKAINGETDVWLAEYDATFEQPVFKDFDFPSSDWATAIYQSPNQKKWMAQYSKSKESAIIAWEKDGLEDIMMKFNRKNDFEIIRIFKTQRGTYIAAGTSRTPSGKKDAIRIIHFKNGDLFTSKGFGKLEVSKKPTLVGSDDDGYISSGEWATIYFSLKNTGNSAIKSGKISVKMSPKNSGLTITRGENQWIPFMNPDKEKEFKIGLRGEDNLGTGKINFEIKIEPEGLLPFTESFTIECEQPQTQPKNPPPNLANTTGTTIFLEQPRIGDGRRKIPIKENKQPFRLSLVTNNRNLKTEDVKIVINDTPQKQQKAEDTFLDFIVEENKSFKFDYSTVLTLSDSINVVYVMVGDSKMDSIVFELRTNAPNLHVLAIGPSYSNLKYTARDARSFAQAFAKQADKGFFNEVFIDTILTELRTTRGGIKSRFKNLLQRWDPLQNQSLPNKIDTSDYLIIFYSGHGVKKEDGFYLMPSDYLVNNDEDLLLEYDYLLREYLNKIKCKKIIFMDACHSGKIGSKNMVDKTLARAIIDANNSAPGLMSFLSCSANESSYEDEDWLGGHGAFTTAILEAVEGDKLNLQSANDEYYVPVSARILFDYLKQRVPELVPGQNPILTTNELPYWLTIFAKEN